YTYFENVEIKDREKKFKIFLLNFFKGYHEENDLPDSQLEFLSVFLKIREIVMYAMLYYWRHFDSCSQWVVEFMKDRKNLLLKGVETIPALNLNII
ncbi:TPA: hypothetical protein TUY21_001881, partial [Streptococcus equi subsp. zooepidemicus]|nr:hypothetical protein [Streptococcus equi subsp. zooepidemicus]